MPSSGVQPRKNRGCLIEQTDASALIFQPHRHVFLGSRSCCPFFGWPFVQRARRGRNSGVSFLHSPSPHLLTDFRPTGSNSSLTSSTALSRQSNKCAPLQPPFTEHTYALIHSSCHSKCINQRYLDGDLSKGESVCIDRCVAKFFDANKKMGEKLQTMGAAAGGAGGFTSL